MKMIIKDTGKLDAAESSKILVEYLKRVLREVFNYLDDRETGLKDRVDFCNSILGHISKCIEKGDFGFKDDEATITRIKGFLVRQDAQMFLSLIDRRKPRYVPMIQGEKIFRSETSLGENSLFTGAPYEPSMVSG